MKILTDILIISLFCNGWYLITGHGMVFFFFHKWYVESIGGCIRSDGEVIWNGYRWIDKILRFFYNPLFGCITCMASIPGSLAYFVLNNFTISWIYPITIIGAACTNLIINRIYDR